MRLEDKPRNRVTKKNKALRGRIKELRNSLDIRSMYSEFAANIVIRGFWHSVLLLTFFDCPHEKR